ncbi:MAG: type VI secretion system tip protein VgrG [Bacteroidetes bacterium]|nr:type VI secretion system tip protein VgrG [Bacteroidota bacterium]
MPLSQTLPGIQNTDLVTFTIKIGGQSVSTQYQVASITVNKDINRLPMARIAIFDGDPSVQDFAVSNEDTFIPGVDIEISAGYHLDESVLFTGIILKHSLKIRNNTSPLLMLDCRDEVVKMTVARMNNYFYDKKDSEAAEEIISSYGFDHDIEDTTVKLQSIVQYDCTDWDFILSRMEACGKVCLVKDGKFTAKKPDFTSTPVLDAVFGATILEFDADLDARNQYQSLAAKTWDYSSQEVTTVNAQEPGFEENGNISSSDLGNTLNIAEYDLYSVEKLTEPELQSLADARLQKARMSRCRGRVRFRGFAGIEPGDLIQVGGVGDRFNGKVYVSGVHHDITNGNWNTDVQFGLPNEAFTQQPDVHSSPASGMLPGIRGLQIGIVTQLASDPDSEHRIRVRLPIINSGEDGIWMRIASLDAGNNRGMFFRPEINDEVVVGFLNDDPRHPIVLGMLNSSAKPAPLPASDQNDEKGFVSRSGMKMIFNDSDKSLKIETPAGKKITISESDGLMKFEDENGNKISMEASSVSVESAANMSLKAGGDLTIQATNISMSPSSSFSLSAGGASLNAGNGSASLSAPSVTVEGSGTTTIKGGVVTIN